MPMSSLASFAVNTLALVCKKSFFVARILGRDSGPSFHKYLTQRPRECPTVDKPMAVSFDK